MTTIATTGTRTATNREEWEKWLDKQTKGLEPLTVRSGGAKGTDEMTKEWTKKRGHKHEEFTAEWGKYGKKAGPMRNAKMIENCTLLIANWNGTSKGTRNTIETAKRKKIETKTLKH